MTNHFGGSLACLYRRVDQRRDHQKSLPAPRNWADISAQLSRMPFYPTIKSPQLPTIAKVFQKLNIVQNTFSICQLSTSSFSRCPESIFIWVSLPAAIVQAFMEFSMISCRCIECIFVFKIEHEPWQGFRIFTWRQESLFHVILGDDPSQLSRN